MPGLALSGDIGIHDPSTIIKEGNKYWIFSTGDGINCKYSTDLFKWKDAGKLVFAKGTWPAWINKAVPGFSGSFWAPDIIYMNGKFYLYYACSTLGSPISAIGLATNVTLDQNSSEYQWKDEGLVTSSSNFADINAIDPSILKDTDGRLYLTYGSFSDGIGNIELDASTGKVKNGATLNRLAGGGNTAWEGSCLIKQGNYYYLFVNRAICCIGTSSTYYIVSGRSTKPTGPFVDKSGIDLRGNNTLTGGTPVLVSSGKYYGPGHFALLRENGRNIVSMHFYDGDANGAPKLDIASLEFTEENWPVINRNPLQAGRYRIINTEKNVAWSAPECAGGDGNKIILDTKNLQTCQQWDLTPMGDGNYKISNAAQSYALTVPFCITTEGTLLQGYIWLNNSCQKFKIDQLVNGQYIISANADKNAQSIVQGDPSFSAASPLSLGGYDGLSSQQWTVQLVDPPALSVSNITDSGFTANWNSIADSSYRMDVSTSLTEAAREDIVAWNIESGTNKAEGGIADNLDKTLSVFGTDPPVYNARGNGGKTAQATGWQPTYNVEKYWQISFRSVDFYNIKVSSKQRSGAGGPRHFKLQYKVGEEGTFSDIPIGIVSNLDNYTAGVLKDILLPQECENKPLIFVRWLQITSTNINESGIENTAQSNIDDIEVTGSRGNFLKDFSNLLINDTSKLLSGLPSGTDFYCSVRGINGNFTSTSSNVVHVVTKGSPSASFSNISATLKNKETDVSWLVSPETNILSYHIERSLDGFQFYSIGNQPPGNYHFIDAGTLTGNNYYRVKAIGKLAIAKYSSVVKVYVEKGNGGIFFYPNPFDGKTLFIEMADQAAGLNDIRFYNSLGQQVYANSINHGGGTLKLTLFPGNLINGIYFLSVINGKNKSSQIIRVNNR